MVFGFDLTYSDLFCFRDSAWLNDDAMHGQNDDRDHDGDNSEGGTGEGGTATDANSGQDTTPNEGKADPNDESDDEPPTQVAGPATRAAATSTTPARVPKIKLNGKVRWLESSIQRALYAVSRAFDLLGNSSRAKATFTQSLAPAAIYDC
ncbi:hypothetical protein PI124_g22649 [Phytophthora idaei]|nr:hypothetical protein PI124_g22649 [Phytophthora idaei]